MFVVFVQCVYDCVYIMLLMLLFDSVFNHLSYSLLCDVQFRASFGSTYHRHVLQQKSKHIPAK